MFFISWASFVKARRVSGFFFPDLTPLLKAQPAGLHGSEFGSWSTCLCLCERGQVTSVPKWDDKRFYPAVF